MSAELDTLTGELAEQLAANDNLPAVDPRAMPTRFSLLKLMAQSPAHYIEACRTNGEDGDSDTASLRIGSGVHAIVLGTPYQHYSGRRAGKEWEAFKRDYGDIPILNDREHHEAMGMASAVMRRREAMQILFEGMIIEQRIDWSYLGRRFRSTPDARSSAHVAELKTATNASPHGFVRDGIRFSYHVQLATYLEAIQYETGKRPDKAYVVTVESRRPYPVTIFRVTDRALEQGAKTLRLWAERLLICEQSNHWPEYADGIVDFDLPEQEPVEIEIDGKLITV